MTLTEEALLQCVPISIRYDSTTETNPEYFTFQISSAVTVHGLSVEPSEAEISIFDRDCELKPLFATVIRDFRDTYTFRYANCTPDLILFHLNTECI